MNSVYEASTSLDAHMILNLLQQEGIQGRVDGEYLPGGVGEIQAINLVRVMVDDADYERARSVIRDWEAIQVDREEETTRKSASGISAFMFGLIIGGGLIFWSYNTPVTEDGIDMNGDGRMDRKRIYRDNRKSRTEVDRNFDGKVDVVNYFDRRGVQKESRYDDNFDGIYETKYRYKNGITHSRESDMNQDGIIDYRAKFRNGNLVEAVILGGKHDSRKKRQKFHMGKLISAEYDTDGDGSIDIKYEYDSFEEVKEKIIQDARDDAPKK